MIDCIMSKSRMVNFLSGYTLITAGVLIVLISDIVRFTRAFSPPVDPTIEVIRFIGLALFFVGIIVKLIYLDDKYVVAFDQHERLFDEIKRIQEHVGLRLPEEKVETDQENPLRRL